MTIDLVALQPADSRLSSQLAAGEAVQDAVVLRVNEEVRRYTVTVHGKVLPGLEVALVSADSGLQGLLRHEQSALAHLCQLAGAVRRGEPPKLPVTLVEDSPRARAVGH